MTREQALRSISGPLVYNINGEPMEGTDHPINYFVRESFDDLNTDAIWDVINERWIKGESRDHISKNYDPKTQFPMIWSKAEDLARAWDIKLGELKRDLVDYEEIIEVLSSVKHRRTLKKRLEDIVMSISSKIDDICESYSQLHEDRINSFSLDSSEVREQWRQLFDSKIPKWVNSKNWTPINIEYKLIEKWRYLSLLAHLKKIWKDKDESESDKIQDIEEIL